MRLLVVDDSELILKLATMALERVAGWEVRTAGSGAEALEAARAEAPGAILLDVVMPGMDGPATLQALSESETTRDIPVILVTARDSAEDIARFERLGAIGVIAKPFRVEALAQQVGELLEAAA